MKDMYIEPPTTQLAVIERDSPTINVKWGYVVSTFSRIHPGNKNIFNAWLSANFDQIRPLTTELTALERLKIVVSFFLGCY